MATVSVNDKEFWLEFIDKYRSLPCLWHVYIKEYSNKPAREDALQNLVEKWKEINPNANKEYVRKRIANLRTSFGREFKKAEKSKRTGSAAQDIYVPNLWYFNDLLFLKDSETTREGTSSLTCSADEEWHDNYNDYNENFSDDCFASPPGESSSTSTISHSSNPVIKRRNLSLDQQQKQFFQKATEFMGQKPDIKTDDEFDIIGKRNAVHFRNMEQTQRLLAEKIVSDVLISGRMGQLTVNSTFIVNPTSQERIQQQSPIMVDPNTFDSNIQHYEASSGNEDLAEFLCFRQRQH